MIFQHTLEQVLDGSKTRTSRLKKPQQWFKNGTVYTTSIYSYYAIDSMGQRGLFNGHRDRKIYYVGQEHAVQPGRAKRGVARIRLLGVADVDVRQYGDAEIRAEGFSSRASFLRLWVAMHVPWHLEKLDTHLKTAEEDMYLSTYWSYYLKLMDKKLFSAWALDFELVE